MALSLLTPWQSSAPLDLAKARARFEGGAYDDQQVAAFLDRLTHHAGITGMATAALAAQVAKETANFRYGNQVKPGSFNFAGIGAVNEGGGGHSFGSIDGGVRGLLAHHANYLFGPLDRWPPAWGPYKALAIRNAQVLAAGYGGVVRTIGDYTNKRWAWTPSIPEGSLANGYARGIVTIGNTLLGGTTVGHVPQPPITKHIVTLPPRQDGVGLNVNARNRQPGATVLHSMGGTLKGTDGYFDNADCPALTDYGIGQTDHGGGFAQIIQWCDFRGRIEPWASGPVKLPEGDGPRWLAHIGGAGAVNEVGVSLEHDDTTRGDGSVGALAGAEATAYQWAASVWLQAWLHAEVFGQTASTYDWNIHHREICGHAYKDCPRPRIHAHTAEYQAAVKAIMAHYQEGTPYPAGGLVINGMKITTPPAGGGETGGDEVKVPARGTAVSYLTDDGQPVTVIAWDGEATKIDGTAFVDLGISITNKKAEKWDRSLVKGTMKPWVKRP